jgi:toxin ParE1/3/4
VTRVTWAPQAIQDVEAIRAHIARDSAHYADLAVERIVAAVERVNDNPRLVMSRSARSSTATTESSTALRHDVVEIATVFHGARLFRLD